MTLASGGGGESDIFSCGPPDSFSFHLAISSVTLAGFVQKSRGDNLSRRGRGATWLNPFPTVLFNVCSAVTVECCVLYPCCVGVLDMFAVM